MSGLKVSEAQLQQQVIQLAQLSGWIVAHFRTARTSSGDYITPVAADGKGFPDLVLVHSSHGLLFRELKSATGRLSVEQRRWLDVLTDAGLDAAVWRPDDWDEIEATLTGRTS